MTYLLVTDAITGNNATVGQSAGPGSCPVGLGSGPGPGDSTAGCRVD
jgi:hypothetical protein